MGLVISLTKQEQAPTFLFEKYIAIYKSIPATSIFGNKSKLWILSGSPFGSCCYKLYPRKLSFTQLYLLIPPGWSGPSHSNLEELGTRLHVTGVETAARRLYNFRNNPSSATNWAADLLRLILKNARQQWDHRNHVLHKLEPNWVKDRALDIKIWLQYDRGRDSLPRTSKSLLDMPLARTLSLPHHEKQQWLNSIKTARKRQCAAATWIAATQQNLMEQLFRRTN